MSYFMLLILICINLCYATKPTLRMPQCKYTDESCLKSAAMLGLQSLREPNLQLDLPSIDPFVIERIHVRANTTSKVCFTQEYYDFKFIGMSMANVTNFEVKISPAHVYLNFSLEMKVFDMVGYFKWNGTVMGHVIDGYGLCNITSVNVTHVHKLTLKRNIKNDKLRLIGYDVDLQPTSLLFSLPNLVRGNPTASKETERFFNQNGMQIFFEVKDDYDRIFGKIFYPYACAFFKKLFLHDLFYI
ncbi:protein takeout-like [Atheta coriaria]|uniref:protein takeout-like n=1 Tax=Dalotia coriaria TaxID=877792 RepID=UPI0031F42A5F